MKKLIFASLALVALASCSKESMQDPAIATGNQISFNAYSQLAQKGAPVNDNNDFKTVGKFFAAAYDASDAAYIPFQQVSYTAGASATTAWNYANTYYWPASGQLTFAAYAPETSVVNYAYTAAAGYTFEYTADEDVTAQQDVMFALNKNQSKIKEVPMHFKHALTQVGFAVKVDPAANITVGLKSISICKVKNSGKFTAAVTDGTNANADGTVEDADVVLTAGTWADITATALKDYKAEMISTLSLTSGLYSVPESATDYTMFTSAENPLMLIPQELTAWTPEQIAPGGTPAYNDECYLAIECKIAHKTGITSTIVDGTIYVPFNSLDDSKNEIWKAGNKLTYNINFGGGYPVKPGEPSPDPEVDESLPTLQPITYTVTCDEWKSVPSVDLSTTAPASKK